MRAYAHPVSIPKLFAILVAIAVLFAPAFSGAGEASAAVPNHHGQMMASGHCQSMPSATGEHEGSSDHEKAGKSCCISMCMAVALATPAPAAVAAIHDTVTSFPAPNRYHGLPAEIATPPPRPS